MHRRQSTSNMRFYGRIELKNFENNWWRYDFHFLSKIRRYRPGDRLAVPPPSPPPTLALSKGSIFERFHWRNFQKPVRHNSSSKQHLQKKSQKSKIALKLWSLKKCQLNRMKSARKQRLVFAMYFWSLGITQTPTKREKCGRIAVENVGEMRE